MSRSVVITGLGAVTPLGNGAATLVDRWSAGECGVADGVAPCADFSPTDVLTPKEARRTDRFCQLAIAAAQEAVDQAGWGDGLPYPAERVGCVIGTGVGGIATIVEQAEILRARGERAVSALAIPLLMPNAASAMVAMRHGLRGPSAGVVSACAAGAHSIGAAVRLIAEGEADAVVTGGAEAPLTALTKAGFDRMGATSPTGVSRPFDARRDGFVLGEGAGVLVLEEAGHAAARGATVIAEIRGYAATSDAGHLTAPDADGGGASRAILCALEDAGLRPEDVDYVNAHGTSTPLNDRAETAALRRALGEHAGRVPISSTKSAVGHLLGAAGAVEAVATAIALQRREIPPTIGYEEVEPGVDLDYVPDGPRPLDVPADRPAYALSNSFGFGGHNAVLCLAA